METRFTEQQVRDQVEALVVKAGSLRKLAIEWEMSPAYLSDFLNGRRGAGPQIVKPLGLVQCVEVYYVAGEQPKRRRKGQRSDPA